MRDQDRPPFEKVVPAPLQKHKITTTTATVFGTVTVMYMSTDKTNYIKEKNAWGMVHY